MNHVSLLIEVDGREKLRLSLSPQQVNDFAATGKLNFKLEGFKLPDEGGKYGQYESAEINP